MAKVLSALSLVMFSFLICGCTRTKDDTTIRTPDVPLESPSDTPDIGWQLPSNYVTHTDSTGLFSVSYPPGWEENRNPVGTDLQTIENIIEKVNAGALVDQAGPVFFWGVPSATGYNPSCNLVVEPRPESIRTIQQVMKEQIAVINEISQEFEEVVLETLISDGRESAVLEYIANIYGVDVHSLVLVTIVGDTIWTNGCLVRQELADYSDYEIDFWNIVRSLKIHQ